MRTVAFTLPLDPALRFTPEALEQLAQLVPGTPVRVAGSDGRGLGEPVGTVTAATVDGDAVRCTADVDDQIADIVGGYGIDGAGRLSIRGADDKVVDSVTRASVAAVPPNLLPNGARRPETR